MARLIQKARDDEQVKALVLRVDSPGGSAFASEIIRREIERVREAGKPVIASMSSVAASGGYWISMSADEIWAAPTSITGSIGIYAMLPTFPRTLERLGVHNDGVGTGELAGTLRPERALPQPAVRAMEQMIQHGYREFIQGVAEGRGKDLDEVDAIARGRVWVGVDAHARGLVDELGGLQEAVAAAAARAGLGDDYRVTYLEVERDWRDRILGWLLRVLAEGFGGLTAGEAARGRELLVPEGLVQDVSALTRYGDPNGLYAYCFCEPN